MIVSLNEIESLAYKAARGAGLSWGLAEEVAVAASWLAAQDIDWEEDLERILPALNQYTIPAPTSAFEAQPAARGAILCPLRTGAYLSDCGGALQSGRRLVLGAVAHPLWLAPFACRLTRDERLDVHLSWEGVDVLLSRGRCDVAHGTTSALHAASGIVTLELTEAAGSASHAASTSLPRAYSVDDDAWARLQAWEARTYVPASVESRLAGAGAGLSDND